MLSFTNNLDAGGNKRNLQACPCLGSFLSLTCPGPRTAWEPHAECAIQAWCQGSLPKNHPFMAEKSVLLFQKIYFALYCAQGSFVTQGNCGLRQTLPRVLWTSDKGWVELSHLCLSKCVASGDINTMDTGLFRGVLTYFQVHHCSQAVDSLESLMKQRLVSPGWTLGLGPSSREHPRKPGSLYHQAVLWQRSHTWSIYLLNCI